MTTTDTHTTTSGSVGETAPARASETNVYTIVTQAKSFRVVYFTSDPEYIPVTEGDWYFSSSYRGALPDGMTVGNCWAWRFNGNAFVYAGGKASREPAERLLESNRKALRGILRDKLQRLREPYLPSDHYGHELRRIKRSEAERFLANPDQPEPLRFLEATAVARNLTLLEAAELIVSRARQTDDALVATERVRERFALLIEQAQTEERLLVLRSVLLEDLYPELSEALRHKPNMTTPIDKNAILSEAALTHERSRLRAQLRERISELREPRDQRVAQSQYVMEYKAKAAALWFAADAKKEPAAPNKLLTQYAAQRRLTLFDAAKEWVTQAAISGQRLIETEIASEIFLAEIGQVKTLLEIQKVVEKIDRLVPALPRDVAGMKRA
jgi:hypothetical protein